MANKQEKTAPKKSNKVLAASLVGLAVVSGVAGAGIHALTAEPVTQEVVVEKNVTVEVPYEVIVEKIVEVPVNVTETVEVDNGNLAMVLDEIFDNDGNVEYLTEDLKDSEVAEIVDRIVFVNEIKAMAVAEAKAEIADLVDKEIVNGEELDEDDVEKVRVDDEADEIVIDEIDFDDKDAELIVSGSFRHDDKAYNFEVMVEIVDSEVEDITLVSLEED